MLPQGRSEKQQNLFPFFIFFFFFFYHISCYSGQKYLARFNLFLNVLGSFHNKNSESRNLHGICKLQRTFFELQSDPQIRKNCKNWQGMAALAYSSLFPRSRVAAPVPVHVANGVRAKQGHSLRDLQSKCLREEGHDLFGDKSII